MAAGGGAVLTRQELAFVQHHFLLFMRVAVRGLQIHHPHTTATEALQILASCVLWDGVAGGGELG